MYHTHGKCTIKINSVLNILIAKKVEKCISGQVQHFDFVALNAKLGGKLFFIIVWLVGARASFEAFCVAVLRITQTLSHCCVRHFGRLNLAGFIAWADTILPLNGNKSLYLREAMTAFEGRRRVEIGLSAALLTVF
ncbi:hypothetical protein [Geomonas edaphica]|uniref:hypothetical protein n=1 Tax=Geomonas edaphica TaxID=2570226 RepID=UPI0013A5ECD5|nr:hypothetical protein [Geomonas edaphica]